MGWLIAIAIGIGAPHLPPPEPPTWAGGRVLTTPTLHVGVRPQAFVDNEDDGRPEWGLGITVQVSVQVF